MQGEPIPAVWDHQSIIVLEIADRWALIFNGKDQPFRIPLLQIHFISPQSMEEN